MHIPKISRQVRHDCLHVRLRIEGLAPEGPYAPSPLLVLITTLTISAVLGISTIIISIIIIITIAMTMIIF